MVTLKIRVGGHSTTKKTLYVLRRHPQLRSGGFCWSNVLLPRCWPWRKIVHSDKAADTSNVGVNLISVLYHFCLSLVKPHFCVKLPLYHISHTKGMDSLKVSIPYFAVRRLEWLCQNTVKTTRWLALHTHDCLILYKAVASILPPLPCLKRAVAIELPPKIFYRYFWWKSQVCLYLTHVC